MTNKKEPTDAELKDFIKLLEKDLGKLSDAERTIAKNCWNDAVEANKQIMELRYPTSSPSPFDNK